MKPSLNDAMRDALIRHYGQLDKSGMPYIAHICAVVAGVKTEKEKTVAALHDLVEDCDVTLEYIHNFYGEEVAEAVDALTRRKGEDYLKEFIPRVAKNDLAKAVKISDLKHNCDLSRLPKVTSEDRKRRDKYEYALAILFAPAPQEDDGK